MNADGDKLPPPNPHLISVCAMPDSPSEIESLLERARTVHQAGNLAAATEIYRRVLQEDPSNSDALYLLGLVAHQRGRHGEALALMRDAETLDPDNLKILNNLGSVHLALGEPETAAAHYRRARTLDPQDHDIAVNLGIAEAACGNAETALDAFQSACEIAPEDAEAWYRRGEQEAAMERTEAAVSSYRAAIGRQPRHAPALFGLGNLHMAQGDLGDAALCYESILAFLPKFHPALFNLGSVREQEGATDEAAEYYRRAIRLKPDFADARFRLGALFQSSGDLAVAREHYEKGLKDAPENAEAWFVYGDILNQFGDHESALRAYDRVLQLNPGDLAARWRARLSLPIVYRGETDVDAARERYARGLDDWTATIDLTSPEGASAAADVLSQYTNFYLPYQGREDRALQEQYGSIVTRTAEAAFPALPAMPAVARDRKHIGFVSANIHDGHTIRKLFGPWMKHLDRDAFQISTFYLGDLGPSETVEMRTASDAFHDGWSTPRAMAERIAEAGLDTIIYPDIGMSPRTQLLAGARLAPHQCVAWGHPVTSGLSTIDHFLSSELMEPEAGAEHYSEALVSLPNLSVCYEAPDLSDAKFPADFGPRDERPVFLCSQSLYKLLPQFDDIYPQIAERVGDCRFWFIESASTFANDVFRTRLAEAFQARGLDSRNHCQIFRRMDFSAFLGLNLEADVILDSLLWSGGNTSLEAFACDRPVVTLPGPMMRGRHTAAMLQRMELPELIAADLQDYADIAAGLATDSSAHAAMVQRISERKDRLFNDRTPIDALAAFLLSPAG